MAKRVRNAKSGAEMLDSRGGAIVKLYVDGRSKVGKLLASYPNPRFKVSKTFGVGFIVHLPFSFEVVLPADLQDQYLYDAAAKAAVVVLDSKLPLDARVETYLS